jgi:hypothetical protein
MAPKLYDDVHAKNEQLSTASVVELGSAELRYMAPPGILLEENVQEQF